MHPDIPYFLLHVLHFRKLDLRFSRVEFAADPLVDRAFSDWLFSSESVHQKKNRSDSKTNLDVDLDAACFMLCESADLGLQLFVSK